MSQPGSGFTRALTTLREAGVDFVVVGVGGINFYARTPGEVFATVDLDTLLRPATENLAAALRVLSGIGYEFEAAQGSRFWIWRTTRPSAGSSPWGRP